MASRSVQVRGVGWLPALLSMIVCLGCDAPGFKSKVKSPSAAGRQSPPVSSLTTTSAKLEPSSLAKQGPAVFTPGLTVSDAIAAACGIPPRANQATMPSFDFDSAALTEVDRQMLGDVAKCLTEGALKGRSVSLVGRADA